MRNHWVSCAYCLGSHPTQDELEACGDRYWNVVERDAEREREITDYIAQQKVQENDANTAG